MAVKSFRIVALACLFACAASAHASSGMVELPPNASSGPVTVFYPADAEARQVSRAGLTMMLAADAPPAPGNRRLVVISHGSPGSPWVYYELARTLVAAGFTVALPEHHADNYKDASEPGPPSWKQRPAEVSRAIDRVSGEPAFAPALDFTQVGMYGMSAGGHTALTLAGGRWSPSRLRQHCRQDIVSDFHACAGLSTSLTGGPLDRVKLAIVQSVIDYKLDDPNWYGHTDPRIRAIVAGVPFAADFDPASLKQPATALAIVSARRDRWLVPQYHSDAVLAACASCEHLADLPEGGHGALLAPLPAAMPEAIAALVGDPPGFDRGAEVPKLNQAIMSWFQRKLAAAGN